MDIRERINGLIIDELESGNIPRKKTWDAIQTGSNGRPYTGMNQLLLQYFKDKHKYNSSRRHTFKQVKDLGCSVLKGEKSTPVMFWKIIKKNDEDGNEKTIPILRYYNVFNRDQTTLGIEETPTKTEGEGFLRAAEIVETFTDGPSISFGPNPSYNPILDNVYIPNESDFISGEEYYATLFHELIHSTGHSKRLDRELSGNMRSESYSKEELIAETGASYLMGILGLEEPVVENSKAYIRGRLSRIKGDKNILISSANKGWKASEYIIDSKERGKYSQ